jgi:hypothetical protein
MKLPLYKEVVLNRDFPQYELKKGDIAMLNDYVPHPADGEEGCILEVQCNRRISKGRNCANVQY